MTSGRVILSRVPLPVSLGFLAFFLLAGSRAYAVSPEDPALFADMDGGGGGPAIDLIVRQVSFSPARAHVGDTIRIEVIVEDKFGEGNKTIPARIWANGKQVAEMLFNFGLLPPGGIREVVFRWDTQGVPPGEYKIKADFFVWDDMSPFDNRMTVSQPLILAPAGASFPDGQPAGGTATETDPRFGKSRLDG